MSNWIDFTQWNNFLYKVKEAEASLGYPKVIWYRGHSRSDYKLIPSLFRYPGGKSKEQDLFEKYKQIAIRIFPERNNDWALLFDMQHYYIPTRLLDWTEVLGVAVFFALLNIESNEAAIFILDPVQLNSKSKKKTIPMVNEDSSFDYKNIYWNKLPFPPNYPVAIEAPFQNERILAQKGKFTIHGDIEKPLEDQFPGCVKKIILPINVIEGAREFLSFSGINEFSVFPDIVGLAPFIKNIVNLGDQKVPDE